MSAQVKPQLNYRHWACLRNWEPTHGDWLEAGRLPPNVGKSTMKALAAWGLVETFKADSPRGPRTAWRRTAAGLAAIAEHDRPSLFRTAFAGTRRPGESDDKKLLRLARDLVEKIREMDALYTVDDPTASVSYDACGKIVDQMVGLTPTTSNAIVAKLWALMWCTPQAYEDNGDPPATTQDRLFREIYADMQRVYGVSMRRVS